MLPRQKNHIKDEIHTPKIKYDVICDGRVVLSPPKSKVLSRRAWGLAHVTKKQEIVVCIKFFSILIEEYSEGLLINWIPIIIIIEPAKRIINLNSGNLFIKNPIPKKHARLNEISKNIVVNTTIYIWDLFLHRALFITYKFCIPIGAR